MRLNYYIRIVIAVVILGISLSGVTVLAEPAAQAPCSNNVLVNPGFEDGFSDRGSGEVTVANGWTPWWQDGPNQEKGFFRRPEFKPEDANKHSRRRIRNGNFAQKVFTTFSTHNAGLYQQVQVPVGSKLTFSAWVQAWSSTEPDPSTYKDPGNYHVYVGIDPTGGTDFRSPNVIWSPGRMEYNTWMQLSVEATATAGTVTVFLRGESEFRVQFNDSYWEDACLNVVRPTPRPTSPPKPTSTPTITPTPEPTATPTNTPLPPPGRICALAFSDQNGDGARSDDETVAAGTLLTLYNAQQVEVGRQTADGSSELCFEDLEAGTYYLRLTTPQGLATGTDNWAVVVSAGQTASLLLPLRPVPTATATPAATAAPSPTPTPVPSPGIGTRLAETSGIWLALFALLIPVGVSYLRKRL